MRQMLEVLSRLSVTLVLIAPDGGDAGEQKLVIAIHALLREDEHSKALQNPKLERIEAN